MAATRSEAFDEEPAARPAPAPLAASEPRIARTVAWILTLAERRALSTAGLRALLYLVGRASGGQVEIRPREADTGRLRAICPEHAARPTIGVLVAGAAVRELADSGLIRLERQDADCWLVALPVDATGALVLPGDAMPASCPGEPARWATDDGLAAVGLPTSIEVRAWEQRERAWRAIHERCESPIEVMLIDALMRCEGFAIHAEGVERVRGCVGTGPGCLVFQQVDVDAGDARVRLDFAITDDSGAQVKIAIETDGHDWHERTKEQATRDKARDRALQADGWRVLRFTGSEVWGDAAACAREIAATTSRFVEATTPGRAHEVR